MPDPYQLDDEGNPVAEPDSVAESDSAALADPAAAGDPAAEAALRRQVEATLRFMRLQTAVGLVVIVVLAIVLSDVRGVMILVGIVFALTSTAAYWFLRRNLNSRVLRDVPPA